MPSSAWKKDVCRSEEHTSELQSLTNLVCRLLLEKTAHISALMHQAREHLPATATRGLARNVIRKVSPATPFKALSLSRNAEQSFSFFLVPTATPHAFHFSPQPPFSN